MYKDKTLICKDCGKPFVFTAAEQEFYATRGFSTAPTRCKDCRKARKGAGTAPIYERALKDPSARKLYRCSYCGRSYVVAVMVDAWDSVLRRNGATPCPRCNPDIWKLSFAEDLKLNQALGMPK